VAVPPPGLGVADLPLKRLKAGPFEVEWAALVEKVGEHMPALQAAVVAGTRDEELRALLELADRAPTTAVIASFNAIEGELRRIAEENKFLVDDKMSPVELAHLAARQGLLREEVVPAVHALASMRNLAVRQPAHVEVKVQEAREYVTLVQGVLSAPSGVEGQRPLDRRAPSHHRPMPIREQNEARRLEDVLRKHPERNNVAQRRTLAGCGHAVVVDQMTRRSGADVLEGHFCRMDMTNDAAREAVEAMVGEATPVSTNPTTACTRIATSGRERLSGHRDGAVARRAFPALGAARWHVRHTVRSASVGARRAARSAG
jgi:hypothetical protein